ELHPGVALGQGLPTPGLALELVDREALGVRLDVAVDGVAVAVLAARRDAAEPTALARDGGIHLASEMHPAPSHVRARGHDTAAVPEATPVEPVPLTRHVALVSRRYEAGGA